MILEGNETPTTINDIKRQSLINRQRLAILTVGSKSCPLQSATPLITNKQHQQTRNRKTLLMVCIYIYIYVLGLNPLGA